MDPIIGASLISAGTGLASGILGKKSAGRGAKDMARAMREGIALTKKMYETGRTDLSPYRAAGTAALPYLQAAAGKESPLYRQQIEDTEEAINRSLSARGQWGSGAGLEVLSSNARRLAASESQARWGRNQYLTDLGSGAAKFTAGTGMQAAGTAGSLYGQLGAGQLGAGLTQANLYGNTAAAMNQAVQGGLSNYYFNQYLQNQPATARYTPNSPTGYSGYGGWGGTPSGGQTI